MTSRAAGLLLALAVISALPLAAGEPRTKERPSIAQLIERLDSDDFDTREAATKALMEREDALPALREVAKTGTAEARRRAEEIIAVLKEGPEKRHFQRVMARAASGEIDQLIDGIVPLNASVGDKEWAAVFDVAKKIVDEGNTKHKCYKRLAVPDKLDKNLSDKVPPNLKALLDERWLAEEIVGMDYIRHCAIVCQGRVRVADLIDRSVIFANGDVITGTGNGKDMITDSVIFADGNIETDRANDCVLIATGSVKFRCSWLTKADFRKTNIIVENSRAPLDCLKLFDTRAAGIEVAESAGRVVVKKVIDGTPFAKSGIREGDRVMALDGKEVKALNELRRLIRRSTVAGQEVAVKAGRGSETLTLKVKFTD